MERSLFSVSGAPGALQDIDIYGVEAGTTKLITADTTLNEGGDPLAFLNFQTSKPYDILIAHCNEVSDPPPLMKWISLGRISSIVDLVCSPKWGVHRRRWRGVLSKHSGVRHRSASVGVFLEPWWYSDSVQR